MSGSVICFLWIFYIILCFILYHKVFAVYYFGGIGKGILRELIGCGLASVVLVILTLKFWLLTILIMIVVGLIAMGKCKSQTTKGVVAVLLIVSSIIIAIVGIGFNKDAEEQNNNTSMITKEQMLV